MLEPNSGIHDSQYSRLGKVTRKRRALRLQMRTTRHGLRRTVTVASGTQSASAGSGQGGSSAAHRHFCNTSTAMVRTDTVAAFHWA